MSSIFLSHSHEDKKFVRVLAANLKRHGIEVWVDDYEIKIGDSLIQKIEDGIDRMQYLGAILSPNSVGSEWVRRELEVALNDEILGKKVKVLPILAASCSIPNFLSGKLYADFTDKAKFGSALEKLLMVLSDKKNKSSLTPGRKAVLVKDFMATLEEYFFPRKVVVQYYDGNNGYEGIGYIRVNYTDCTFELYNHETTPLLVDLLNIIFGDPSFPEIKDYEFTDTSLDDPDEFQEGVVRIQKKYNIPNDKPPGNWRGEARKEFEILFNSDKALLLIF